MAEAHARKCSGDSSQCRNSDEQIGRTCEYKHAVAVYFCRECAEERNQSVRKLNAGRLTCLVPRSHRNAGLQPLLHAHVIREDDAPERQSQSSARSALPDAVQEHVALCAIRSETRSGKWARGSRSQTHRRAAKGGFTQDDVKVRRPRPDRNLLFRFLTLF